jgi:SCY1-like protein 1
MRDPFPLARLSGIVAIANTDRYYTLKDVATKVLPSLCMLTVDPEKDVRDEAFKTIKQYVQKLEKVSEQPELALEMEKDVQSCALDVKNETSWTSWAVNSLSTKMSNYKNKAVQPSVALNTQPLGPPPGLDANKPANPTSADKKPESVPANAANKKDSQSPQQKQLQQRENSSNFALSFGEIKNETSAAGGGGGGWGFDDNDDEWKDLDDGDQMEPLEPFQSSTFQASSKNSKSNTNMSSGNSDWSSDWKNSFEEIDNKGKNQSGANLYSLDSIKNEEDLFSSLVKDVSISKVI